MQRSSELDELGLEANRVALTCGHDAPRIVEEPLVRHAAEKLRRAPQRADEAHRRLLEYEFCPQRARVAQEQHEAVQWPRAALDADVAHVSPVDLRLLAGQPLQP